MIVAPILALTVAAVMIYAAKRRFADALEANALKALEAEVFWIATGMVGEIADIVTDGLVWYEVVWVGSPLVDDGFDDDFFIGYSIVFGAAVVFTLLAATARCQALHEIWTPTTSGRISNNNKMSSIAATAGGEDDGGDNSQPPEASSEGEAARKGGDRKMLEEIERELKRTRRKIARTEHGLMLAVVEDMVLLVINIYILSHKLEALVGSGAPLTNDDRRFVSLTGLACLLSALACGYKFSQAKLLIDLSHLEKHLVLEQVTLLRHTSSGGDEEGGGGGRGSGGVAALLAKTTTTTIARARTNLTLQSVHVSARPAMRKLMEEIGLEREEVKLLRGQLAIARFEVSDVKEF
jgi:hypothetical protein